MEILHLANGEVMTLGNCLAMLGGTLLIASLFTLRVWKSFLLPAKQAGQLFLLVFFGLVLAYVPTFLYLTVFYFETDGKNWTTIIFLLSLIFTCYMLYTLWEKYKK